MKNLPEILYFNWNREHNLKGAHVFYFIVSCLARLQEVVVHLEKGREQPLSLLLIFSHSLTVVYLLLKQVKDAEDREPAFIVLDVEVVDYVGYFVK